MKRRAPERHTTFFNLTDALAAKGCALCSLTAKSARDYLDAVFYESVTDTGTRKTLSKSLGFCAMHARLARDMNNASGIALIYEQLCCDVAERIQNGERPRVNSCPVCNCEAETEKRYVSEFGAHIGATDCQEKFRASDGFCLAHFEKVMLALRDKDSRALVESHHVKTFQSLARQLQQFIEKQDYQNTADFGAEADAWQRALDKFVGKLR